MLTVLLQVRYHREGQAQGGRTRTREPVRCTRCGSGNRNSSNMLRGQRGGYKRVQGRTNERKVSVGGTSECGGVQASTGDSTTSASRYEGCTGEGMNMHWEGGTNKRTQGKRGGCERVCTNADGSGNGGSGDTMWPPFPFYYYFLVFLIVIFTYKYVHNIF